MRLLISSLVVLIASPQLVSADSLSDVHWHVTSIERGGERADDFTITESKNGGTDTVVYNLDSIRFTNKKVTFCVGSSAAQVMHELKATTSRRPGDEEGRFKIKLLGKVRDCRWAVNTRSLVLTVHELGEDPLVIKANHSATSNRRITKP